jgi:tetraacyldisaccharide 4'-kinase
MGSDPNTGAAPGFPDHWSRLTAVSAALAPLSWLFRAAAAARRALYRARLLRSRQIPVPVIVIGNLVVGGTGKTPLVLALAARLREAGYRPGLVSRGYGGAGSTPFEVGPDEESARAGDEAVLLAWRSGCPVWVGKDRSAAALALLHGHPDCNLILSDDGLQHYGLARDIEIAVEDSRGHGNGLLLPAGPLREPASRAVDALVINGEPNAARRTAIEATARAFRMDVEPEGFYRLAEPDRRVEPGELRGKRLHALAGIGEPQRFFRLLAGMGIDAAAHPFPDHHPFSAKDLDFQQCDAVLMTEKDAVKCRKLARPDSYALRVRAKVDPAFFDFILARLRGAQHGHAAS